jgi:eukaryotic-like serine/threonine-protein kinase
MPDRVGRRFGRYKIVQELGRGGMGDVYRARDLDLEREVAIKFLRERYATDPERLARFDQEARAASALNHPNIVTVHEVGDVDGLPYIVMELILGPTLRSLLDEGQPLSLRKTLDLGTQMAAGLAKAHAAGIVHRDLKPENLMLSEDGYLKIVDFGLAKLRLVPAVASPQVPSEVDTVSRTDPLLASPDTEDGRVLGTIGYLAPEQAAGRPADFRADQFSAGAILYEMATGRRAFRRQTATQTLAAVLEGQPESISVANPSVPPPLRWIIERCLAKDPADRYASTLDLARALESVREHLAEITTVPPGPPDEAPRKEIPPPRWRRAAAVVAALGLLGLGYLAIGGRAPKHIAILPFECSGGDPADATFCRGLVEQLASDMTTIEQLQGALRVVPPSEVRTRRITSAEEARKAFGATHAVSGSVQRLANQVRLISTLIDARELRQLRARQFDVPVLGLAELQSRLAQGVAAMVEVELKPEVSGVLAAGQTQASEAYELYVKGRGDLLDYDRLENLDRAIASFREATHKDPKYALAWAGLGEALWRKYESTRNPDLAKQAAQSCERAKALSDVLSPVLVTLGLIRTGTGDPAGGLREVQEALKRNPGNPEAYRGLGYAYAELGDTAQAEKAYRDAIRLKPDDWAGYNQLGALFFRLGRYREAEEQFVQVTKVAPQNVRGWSNLGALYHLLGRAEEAEATLRTAVGLVPTSEGLNNLATVQFYRGNYRDAVNTLEQAVALAPHDPSVRRGLAAAHLYGGDAGKAKQAYAEARGLARAALDVNPRDASLRAELADILSMLGDAEAARAEATRALELAPRDPQVLFRVGAAYEQMGDRERALPLISQALAAGYSRREVENDPSLRELRADPRFANALSAAPPAP